MTGCVTALDERRDAGQSGCCLGLRKCTEHGIMTSTDAPEILKLRAEKQVNQPVSLDPVFALNTTVSRSTCILIFHGIEALRSFICIEVGVLRFPFGYQNASNLTPKVLRCRVLSLASFVNAGVGPCQRNGCSGAAKCRRGSPPADCEA